MDGILLVDKPAGWTSFDVVAKVRGILKKSGVAKPKVGHSGTLDPLATGLLVLLIGSYTKRADTFTKLDKVYEATIYLGETSTTADEEGEKTHISDRQPNEAELKQVIKRFTGELEQIPPAHSAIKINGQRAYKLVRSGVKPELKPRNVHIYELKINSYSYPKLDLTAHVSSGTYVRSLAQDIGDELGTGAYLSVLRRTRVGSYSLTDSISIDKLTAELIHQHLVTG